MGSLSRRPFPLPVLDHLRAGAIVRMAQILTLAPFQIAVVRHPVALVHRALLSAQADISRRPPPLRFRVQGGQGRRATRSGACLEGHATLSSAAGVDGGNAATATFPRPPMACHGRAVTRMQFTAACAAGVPRTRARRARGGARGSPLRAPRSRAGCRRRPSGHARRRTARP